MECGFCGRSGVGAAGAEWRDRTILSDQADPHHGGLCAWCPGRWPGQARPC